MAEELAFIRYGKGAKVVVAFHGISMESSSFEAFENEDYSIYSFDLPFHGKLRNYGKFLKNDWLKDFEKCLEKLGIAEFELLAYSLGGRFALFLIEQIPQRIQKVTLISPDGIRVSPYYKIATHNLLSRKVFKFVLFNPNYFKNLANVLVTLKLANKSTGKFSEKMLVNEATKSQVYLAWTSFRTMRFDLAEIAKKLNEFNIEVVFIMGEYDQIIKKSAIIPLYKLLNEKQLIVYKTGHTKLLEKAAEGWFEIKL